MQQWYEACCRGLCRNNGGLRRKATPGTGPGRRPDYRPRKRCGLFLASWPRVCAWAPGRSNDKSESIRQQGFVSLMSNAGCLACRPFDTRQNYPATKQAERDQCLPKGVDQIRVPWSTRRGSSGMSKTPAGQCQAG